MAIADQPYNPVKSNQDWQNEFGFIGSFTSPNESPASEALHRGAVGMAAGAAGGAMTGRNAWLTGANTGIGTAAGNLLARLLTSNVEDAGTRESWGTLGALAGAGTGFGLSQYMKDGRKKKTLVGIPLPGGAQFGLTTKTASLNSIMGQLPNIRMPDSIAGGALGAGGGWLYDKLQRDENESAEEQRKKKWNRVLGGAGIGAVGANIAGDRGRRYLSNKINPFGYKNPEGLSPKNFKEFWDGAILDKPLQEPVKEFMRGEYRDPFTSDKRALYNNTAANWAMRRETMRRGMGVHTSNPATDIFKTQHSGADSINPQHPNATSLVREMMYPTDKGLQLSQLLLDPQSSVATINSGKEEFNAGLMSNLVGGQRISAFPYDSKHNKSDLLLNSTDRFDFGLDSGEWKNFKNSLRKRFVTHDLGERDTSPSAYDVGNSNQPDTAKARQVSDLKRLLLEHVVMKDPRWVSQRMYMRKLPDNVQDTTRDTGYAAIPATEDGEMYPGDSVATYEPSSSSAKFHSAGKILPQLKKDLYIPAVSQSARGARLFNP